VRVLNELGALLDWVHGPADDERSWDKAMKLDAAPAILDGIIAAYETIPWERDSLHGAFMAVAAQLEINPSKVQGPIRVPITGRIAGLPLFELLEWLGRDEALRRLNAGRARLG
jgi:glutamyl-tRNA synthetase